VNIDDLKGEELFSYLRKNKATLLQQKKGALKLTDSVVCEVTCPNIPNREISVKALTEGEEEIPGELEVTVVANAANIIDSHLDMLTDGAYAESLKLRGNTIPHLLDHNHSAIGHIGDVKKVYTKKIDLKTLGIDAEGTTTALLMETLIKKDYNTEAFKFYANGKINQHSIGLTYGEIALAVNSSHERDKKEKGLWDKMYPKVINKAVADARGYFYVVSKVDVRENSAVLFGSNPLTPTLSVKTDNINLTEGTTDMNIEELQETIVLLNQELSETKASLALAETKGRLEEKTRILGILDAAKTFGNSAKLQEAALSFIKKDLPIETTVISFEVIKESSQNENFVDSAVGLNSSVLPPTQNLSTKDIFLKAMETASAINSNFEGLL
jgi:hypothetical protein